MLKYIAVLPSVAVEKLKAEIELIKDCTLQATLTELASPKGLEEGFKLVELIFILPSVILRREDSRTYNYKHHIQKSFNSITFKEDGTLGVIREGRQLHCSLQPIVMLENFLEIVSNDVYWLVKEDDVVFVDDLYFTWLTNELIKYRSKELTAKILTNIAEKQTTMLDKSRILDDLDFRNFIKDMLDIDKANNQSKATMILTKLTELLTLTHQNIIQRKEMDKMLSSLKEVIKL